MIYSINDSDTTYTSSVRVYSDLGLEAEKILVAEPMMLDAPEFISTPSFNLDNNGSLVLDYTLDLNGRDDMSNVTWYRCSSLNEAHPIPVKITRFNNPIKQYQLTKNDVGSYIMAEITPKHMRSNYGKPVRIFWEEKINADDVNTTNSYYTDFTDFPETHQPKIKPGIWTVDGYKPQDPSYYTDG